jgi:CubicO group peptidase (beta-lactamase class C family)
MVVILFLGVSIVPSTGGIEDKDENLQLGEQSGSIKNLLFDLYLNSVVKICRLPSLSACAIRDGKVVWAKAYGLYDIENKKEATKETIYLVQSVSKPVAATALMQLYEQGLFDLDEDVSNYLPFSLRNPNYPDDPITFRMLLSHQSSLAYDEEQPMVEYLKKIQHPGDPNESSYPHPWLENYLCPGGDNYTAEVWVDEKPGTNYHYANIGYGLIGYLIELISCQGFNEYCKEHIFTPLGMENTSYLYADLNNSKIAIPYGTEDRIIPPLIRMLPYSYYWAPCCNLKTTVMDLSHFLIAHMNSGMYNDVRILNESTVELMHTVQYPNNTGEQYGLGWNISENGMGEKMFGHAGGGLGVRTHMLAQPSDNIAFIYFTNTWTWRLTPLVAPRNPYPYLPLIPFSLLQKAKHS